MFYKYSPHLLRFETEPVVPMFRDSVVDVQCCYCHRITRCEVKPEYADYQSLAECYRRYAEKITLRYDRIAKDTEALHGENPAAIYFSNEIKAMLADMQKEFFPNRYDPTKDR